MSSAGKHHEISKIGEALLKEALEKANPGKDINLQSFYLGNWLTDFSQGIDPVAFKKFEGYLTGTLKAVSDTVENIEDGFKNNARSTLKSLDEGVAELNELKTGIEFVDKTFHIFLTEIGRTIEYTDDKIQATKFAEKLNQNIIVFNNHISSFILGGNDMLVETDETGKEKNKYSELVSAIRATVTVIGYSKFVLDTPVNNKTKMNDDIYLHIVEKKLTQYYPNEHLDRSDSLDYQVGGQQNYIMTVAERPLSKNSRMVEKNGQHLYQYLRDDIYIIAGQLSAIDKNWAESTFNVNKNKFIGKDKQIYEIENSKEWDIYLAELGHALHGIEDYFAHSNFIEQADELLIGGTFEKENQRIKEPSYKAIVSRRLKVWPGPEQEIGNNPEDELNIATGYFDFIDTLHSLTHMAESLFNWPHELFFDKVQKVSDKAKDTKEFEYKQFFTDSLELLTMKPMTTEALLDFKKNNPENLAMKYIDDSETMGDLKIILQIDGNKLKERSEKIKKLASFLASKYYGQSVPDDIRKKYVEAIELWTRVKSGVSLYKSVKELIKFFSSPMKWLTEKLPEFLEDGAEDLLKAYTTSFLHRLTGSQRIGCHSLMAKDIGDEIFHAPSFVCAQSVHWYVVKQLISKQNSKQLKVKTTVAKDSGYNKLALSHIDWLELLEYFLSHPASHIELQTKTTKTQIVEQQFIVDAHKEPSTLEAISKTFSESYQGEGELTWETLARYNYPLLEVYGFKSKREIKQAEIDVLEKNAPLNLKQWQPGLEEEINRILTLENIAYPVKNNNMAFQTGTIILIPDQKEIKTSYISSKDTDFWWYHVNNSSMNNPWKIFESWSENKKMVKNKAGKAIPPHRHIPVRVNQATVNQLIESAEQLQKDEENSYNHLAGK